MNGEVWPKEEQRLRNGACGQVPIEGVDRVAAGAALGLDLEWLRLPPAPQDTTTPVHAAIDITDSIFAESLDMAQHVIGHSALVRDQMLALATAHAAIAARVYVAHVRAEVLRELAPEIAGAISEAGTDIGAGIQAHGADHGKGHCEACTHVYRRQG